MRNAIGDRDQLITDRVFTIHTLNQTKTILYVGKILVAYMSNFDIPLLGILPRCSVLVGLIYYSPDLSVILTNEGLRKKSAADTLLILSVATLIQAYLEKTMFLLFTSHTSYLIH
jgi:hypothetical protein